MSRPAVILATTARERGGIWRHITDLAGELRALGHEVSVALAPAAVWLRADAHERGLATLRFAESVRSREIWHGHLHDTFDRRFLAAVIVRRAIGPTVLTEHLPRSNASDPRLLPGRRHPLARPAKTAFKRVELASTDAVIALSPSSAAFLAERYGARRGVHVVPNGLPPVGLARAAVAPDGHLRVVAIGAVIDQKGHDVLVDAAALAQGGWRATVLGDGASRAGLELLAAATGAPVSFPGWCEDVDAALAAADVACLPSRWEAAPYAALEAMRAGLPLVASDVDGLRDLVEPEISGVLVPPGDAHALAAALDRLSGDPALCRRLGAAARRRAAQFTSARMATETVAVYGAAVAARLGPRS